MSNERVIERFPFYSPRLHESFKRNADFRYMLIITDKKFIIAQTAMHSVWLGAVVIGLMVWVLVAYVTKNAAVGFGAGIVAVIIELLVSEKIFHSQAHRREKEYSSLDLRDLANTKGAFHEIPYMGVKKVEVSQGKRVTIRLNGGGSFDLGYPLNTKRFKTLFPFNSSEEIYDRFE